MMVTLTTRCGCSRQINIPWPHPPEIHLPLTNKRGLFHMQMEWDRLERPFIHRRVFVRYDDFTYVEAEP